MPSYESVSKDVQKLLGRTINLHRDGVPLPKELALFRRALAMRLCLYLDLIGTSPSAEGKWMKVRRTILSLTDIDVGRYASSWGNAKECFLQLLECQFVTREDRIRGFKHRVREYDPDQWIVTSAVMLMEEGVPDARILQWLVFDEKLNFRSLDLVSECVEAYRDAEAEMRDWQYQIPDTLKEVARSWFADFCLQSYPFRPSHGSGATAEVRRKDASWDLKNMFLVSDDRLMTWVKLRDVSNISPDFWFFAGGGAVRRTATLQCVPKSMTKNRTISAEPTVLQFLQQDLFRAMDDWFNQTPVLAKHINMHDQERSRKACLRASVRGDLASVDLSAASDSVTLPLLRELLAGTGGEDLLFGLESTRSQEVLLPDGSTLPLVKYGGMGNGTTFPVETLIFAMICEAAIRDTEGSTRSTWEYYVYGDDILIDVRALPRLYELLDLLHFTVNKTKSFHSTHGHIFREACGMWALDGEEVTPLRLSRRLYWEGGHTPSEAVGWMHLYNDALRYGFLALRRCINCICAGLPWFEKSMRVSITHERAQFDGMYVLTFEEACTNYQIRSRAAWVTAANWRCGSRNCGYQRVQHRAVVPVSRGTARPVSDESRYFSWMLRTLLTDREREDITPIQAKEPAASVLRWAEKWV